MYSRRWTSSIPRGLAVLLMVVVSIAMVTAAATAQQNPTRQGKSRLLADDGPRTRATTNVRPIRPSAGNISGNSGNVKYKAVQIGVLPGYTNSDVADYVNVINNSGHVAGQSWVYNGDFNNRYLTGHPFLWKGGKLTALPLPQGAAAAFAVGINDRDQVIAETNEVDPSGVRIRRAYMVDHGNVILLPALDADSSTQPVAINNWGSAVGLNFNRVTGSANPVVWSGGKIHALPLISGEDGGVAWGINDLGVISGVQSAADGSNQIACLWYWNGNRYSVLALKSLGGDYSDVFGINNWGQAVGDTTDADNVNNPPVLWDWRGPHALPMLSGDIAGFGNAINDLGQITGFTYGVDQYGNEYQRIVLWQNGTVTDLQTVVPAGFPDLTDIGNVNLSGQIVVNTGHAFDGSFAPYVMNPKDH